MKKTSRKRVRKQKKTVKSSLLLKIVLPVIVLLSVALGAKMFLFGSGVTNVQAKTPREFHVKHHKAVCGKHKNGFADCDAHVVTSDAGVPLAGSSPSSSSYGPQQFHTAYNLPCTPNGSTQSLCATPATFGPQTIAIVDAYHMPTIENDLSAYSSQYGISACTKANGCLTVVNQNGGSTLPTTVDSGWSLETALDVETAHAMCQTCKILLVEANSNSLNDLGAAVNAAVNLGATSVSNSYGGSEWSSETFYNSYYTHPGVAVTASTGDNGYGTAFPAVVPGVVAVGGTTLQLFTDNTYQTESVWSGAGSGCSAYETASSWQTAMPNWSQSGCGSKRAIADVSADADPSSGAAVYDSTPYGNSTGWWQVGGTSLASPIVAATYALAGGIAANTTASSYPYSYFTTTNSHDITSGNNGTCNTFMCTGGSAYDGPTGLGTANGVAGFMIAAVNSPTPTNTPSPTPTVSLTPTSTPTDTPTPTQGSSSLNVTITNPTDGSIVRRSSYVTIAASVADTVSVTSVEFYINGALKHTDRSNPYNYSWRVPNARNTKYTIVAKAYDSIGNTSTSSIAVTSSQ